MTERPFAARENVGSRTQHAQIEIDLRVRADRHSDGPHRPHGGTALLPVHFREPYARHMSWIALRMDAGKGLAMCRTANTPK